MILNEMIARARPVSTAKQDRCELILLLAFVLFVVLAS